jgi:hypothetical protein
VAISVDKYTSLTVENYNNVFSIKEGWVGKEGAFKPNFCKREFGKEKIEKKCPVSVRLGDRDTALAVLRELYAEISGGEEVPF